MTGQLQELAGALAEHPAVKEKITIQDAFKPALAVSGGVAIGDDAAAIPDPASGGHLLFAAEGMIDSFVEDDPWFAGYSAVMVNLSDIAAMGGRPVAITDVLWTPDHAAVEKVWDGMRTASSNYGVPIVGGHTTHSPGGGVHLAAAVIGRAGKHLLTSFDAVPGDDLVAAIDLRGGYRGDKPFWNASTGTEPSVLQENLGILPDIAERRLAAAAKDISNGGVIGTLAMLCRCSGTGADLDLDRVPRPASAPLFQWLTSFPSYGYLFAAHPSKSAELISVFGDGGVSASKIGTVNEKPGIRLLGSGGEAPALIAV